MISASIFDPRECSMRLVAALNDRLYDNVLCASWPSDPATDEAPQNCFYADQS